MAQKYLYTDGACSGNPGPGGWGSIIKDGVSETVLSGGERDTTNNRMELTAVISALAFLKQRRDRTQRSCAAKSAAPPAWVSAEIRIYTDSMYVKRGISEWLPDWKRRGWKK